MEPTENKIRLICSSCHTKYAIDLKKVTEQQLKRSTVKCKKCGHDIPMPVPEPEPTESNKAADSLPPDSEPESPAPTEPPPEKAPESEETAMWPQSSFLVNAQEDEPEQDNWMALYGDMMSILLIFFVLMFAISTIDKQKFQSVIEGVSKALGGAIQYETIPQPSAEEKISLPQDEDEINLEQLQEMLEKLQTKVNNEADSLSDLELNLEKLINKSHLENNLSLENEAKGLVLIAQDVSMFKSGSAVITPAIKPILLEVGLILSELNIEIIVEGHTDDIPIHTKEFASNWELSTKRATNVVHFFIEKCAMNPSLVSAAGYASNRPRHSFAGEQASKKKYDTEVLHDIININDQNSIPQFIE